MTNLDPQSAVDTVQDPLQPAPPGMTAAARPQIDYFAPREGIEVPIDDYGSHVVISEMSEGQRRKWLNSQTKMMTVTKSGDQQVPMSVGEVRTSLLRVAIIGWNLVKDGQDFSFTEAHLKQFLEAMPVDIGSHIEDEVMRHNPSLSDAVTLQDLDDAQAEIDEQREALLAKEGKDNT